MFILRQRRFWLLLLLASSAEAVLMLGAIGRVVGGSPLAVMAITQQFSPISVLAIFLPVVGIALGYVYFTPAYFTSWRDWWLLRQRRGKIKELVSFAIVTPVVYVLLSYVLTYLMLMIQVNGPYRALPWRTGVSHLFGSAGGLAFLLTDAVLIVFSQFGLVLLFTLIVRKKWQVFILALTTYSVLPILLFILHILPETGLPIVLYGRLINAPALSWRALGTVLLFQGGLLLGESILFTGLIVIKNRRGWQA
ncbi:hypothetical protein [Schleiferilactobacillus harbinensis]|uniref:hypothetical protein n=1 Tax=Schleiferilactobacillus harbinensis TaxID=304207 RepID=UPI00345EC85D